MNKEFFVRAGVKIKGVVATSTLLAVCLSISSHTLSGQTANNLAGSISGPACNSQPCLDAKELIGRIVQALGESSGLEFRNIRIDLSHRPFSRVASFWCSEEEACTIRIDPLSIKEMGTEAVLAGIIGHEVSHVILEHPLVPSLGGTEQFSADSLGTLLALRAGYDPLLIISFAINFVEEEISEIDLTVQSLSDWLAQDSTSEFLQNRILYCLTLREENLNRLRKLEALRGNTIPSSGSQSFILTNEERFRTLGESLSGRR